MKLPQFKQILVETGPATKTGPMLATDPWQGRVDQYQALRLLDKYGESLEKAGVNISGMPRVLGGDKGAQGTPLDIGGTVLKFTRDRTEANASYRIKGQKLKNVANVYNVYELGDEHIYVIHQELLDPIDSEIKRYWPEIKEAIDEIALYDDFEDAKKRLENEILFIGDQNLKKKIYDAGMQAINGAMELRKNKISVNDRHDENVMQRMDGTLVLIDLGITRSPEVKVPSVSPSENQ
jgi:hypothetical protein